MTGTLLTAFLALIMAVPVAIGVAMFIAYFRSDTLPKGFTPELMVTRHYAQRDYPFIFTNGVQVSHVEVDVDGGDAEGAHDADNEADLDSPEMTHPK